MAALVIKCSTCNDQELAFLNIDSQHTAQLNMMLESMLVTCHSAPPHCGNHTLRFEISDATFHKNEDVLKIECWTCSGNGNTRGETSYIEKTIPKELVGSATLAFHTAHEGHPLRLAFGVLRWGSPGLPLLP